MAKLDLVFEGGGAKGVAFAGALEALAEEGHEAGRVIGASAGAIAAALVAAGYGASSLLEAIRERTGGQPRFTTFFDVPAGADFDAWQRRQSVLGQLFSAVDLPLVPERLEERIDQALFNRLMANRRFRQLFSLMEYGGVFSGDTFHAWVEEKLAGQGIPAGCTLSGFHERTGSDLTVMVSDTTGGEMLALNHRTAPLAPVAWAVRMSMSIPFVWQEVRWQSEWGRYLDRDVVGHAMVDGGMLSNFPIRLLAGGSLEVQQLMGRPRAGAGILGLLIAEDETVPGASAVPPPPGGIVCLPLVQRVQRMLDTMMKARDNAQIRRYSDWICRLPAKGYGTLEFDLEGDRLALLLGGARRATRQHLRRRGYGAAEAA